MAYGAIIGQTPTVQASAEMTSYNNDNTSSVITADNVQGAIDQLFTSVSNGKSQIASAITGMGVSTSANDSFAQMATNIGNIETGPDWSEVQSPAGAAQILAPYQTYDSSNKLIKGTITSKGAQTYTPKTVSQTIAKGQYLSGNQTIQGDGNLKASNIKSGVSIFGVSGSYTGDYVRGYITSVDRITNKKLRFYTNITLKKNILGSVFVNDYAGANYNYYMIFNKTDYVQSNVEDQFGSVIRFPLSEGNILYGIGLPNVDIFSTYFDITFTNPRDISFSSSIGINPDSMETKDGHNGRVIITYN